MKESDESIVMEHEGKTVRKQMLKSTGILGFTQVFIILVGIIRVKVLAILLGAVGVGIAGLYQTTIDLIKSTTNLGIGYSAVRDIATSAATKDEKTMAVSVLVLRRWVWATGLFGMLITIVFRKQLSFIAFGDTSHSIGMAILSITVLLSAIASGQSALLQGLRKIGYVAKANVLNALASLMGISVIYYIWGLKGIVPALVLMFVLTFLVNWYFSSKIKTIPTHLSASEIFRKGKGMISLGFFLTLTGLAATGTMYLVRTFIMQKAGLASVGHFVAAWTISSIYISAIFSAMGADFFPRLSGVHQDSVAVTKMVNAQMEVALLLAVPIIIAMVSFVDLVVRIFYSKDFGPSVSILNWQLLGDFFKILAWPMGFILVAKGAGKLFILAELFGNVLFYIIVYFGWKFFNIQITGIAFLISYIFYALLLFFLAIKLVGFNLSARVKRYFLIFSPLLFLSFLSVNYLTQELRYIVCSILTLTAVAYSYNNLKEIIDFKKILSQLIKNR